VDRVIARWRAEQFVEISARQVARVNPWAGIPGCIYLRRASAAQPVTYFVSSGRALDARLCGREEMLGSAPGSAARVAGIAGDPAPDLPIDDPRWRVPPSLATMLQPLETLHRPSGALYRAYTEAATDDTQGQRHGPNRLTLNGAAIDVGFSVDLT